MSKVFRDVWTHWATDWRHNRIRFWFEFLGTLLSITGTATISFTALHPPMLFCYVVWFLGSVSMVVGAWMRNASWMLLLMFFNTLMNIVGLLVLVLG